MTERKIPIVKNPHKAQVMDQCVLCHRDTEYSIDTPVQFRSNFIEGAGQLCPSCWKNLFGNAAPSETGYN